MLKRIVENVDVIVGNEEDLGMDVGIPTRGGSQSKLNRNVFFGMIDKVTAMYPNVKVVATTFREVHSTNRHSWEAVAWINGKTYQSPTCRTWMWWIVWAAAMAMPRASSTGLLALSDEKRLTWAGRMARCLPLARRHAPWPQVDQVRAFAKGGAQHAFALIGGATIPSWRSRSNSWNRNML